MTLRSSALLTLAALWITGVTHAQTTFPEVEPNSVKTEATAVNGIVGGDVISGTSTGTGAVAGDTALTTVDIYRVKTGALPLGIYRHALALSSATTGNVGTIRGLSQTAGAPTAGTDVTFQTSAAASTPPNANVWYGFGKQEEIYYRVTGAAASTASYSATLTTTTVAPTIVGTSFNAGLVTITTVGQTTVDTEIYVYDSGFNPIAGYHNDDEGPAGATLQSRLVRVLTPGTYYVLVSDYDTANNLGDANSDEDFLLGNVLDFPDALCSGDRETGPVDYDVSITDGVNTANVTQLAGGDYEIAFARITVVAGPPPANDNCASAAVITNSAVGWLPGATNDGAASCDPGGAASRDLWYSFTAGNSGGTISPETCSSSVETVLTVFASCGGAELGCNDDCGGAPCSGPSSCLSGLALAPNQNVLVRVSDKGTGTGTFTLRMNYVGNPPINDLCANAIALPGPGVYGFDTTLATAGQTVGTCSSLPGKNVWFSYAPTTSGTMTVNTCGQITGGNSTDTEIWVYAGAGCPAAPAIACNDDFCGLQSSVTVTTTCGTVYMIEMANFSTSATANIIGTFTVAESGTTCSTPSTPFCDGSIAGTCAGCVPNNNGTAGRGCANSVFAQGTLLSNSGIASLAADTLVLTTTEMSGPGLFFQSNGLASVNPFGDGMLCAAVGIIRMGVVFPISGSASYPGGLTPNPISIAGAPINPGDLKHYQVWYRDAVVFCSTSTFNTSNGISLTWGP